MSVPGQTHQRVDRLRVLAIPGLFGDLGLQRFRCGNSSTWSSRAASRVWPVVVRPTTGTIAETIARQGPPTDSTGLRPRSRHLTRAHRGPRCRHRKPRGLDPPAQQRSRRGHRHKRPGLRRFRGHVPRGCVDPRPRRSGRRHRMEARAGSFAMMCRQQSVLGSLPFTAGGPRRWLTWQGPGRSTCPCSSTRVFSLEKINEALDEGMPTRHGGFTNFISKPE